MSTTLGNIESPEAQSLSGREGAEIYLDAINAIEGTWHVEALLAKKKVGKVVQSLVKGRVFPRG